MNNRPVNLLTSAKMESAMDSNKVTAADSPSSSDNNNSNSVQTTAAAANNNAATSGAFNLRPFFGGYPFQGKEMT